MEIKQFMSFDRIVNSWFIRLMTLWDTPNFALRGFYCCWQFIICLKVSIMIFKGCTKIVCRTSCLHGQNWTLQIEQVTIIESNVPSEQCKRYKTDPHLCILQASNDSLAWSKNLVRVFLYMWTNTLLIGLPHLLFPWQPVTKSELST